MSLHPHLKVEIASLKGVSQSDIDVAKFLANFVDEIVRNLAISISSLKGQTGLDCEMGGT